MGSHEEEEVWEEGSCMSSREGSSHDISNLIVGFTVASITLQGDLFIFLHLFMTLFSTLLEMETSMNNLNLNDINTLRGWLIRLLFTPPFH